MKKRITRKLIATVAVAMLAVTGAFSQYTGTDFPGDSANYGTTTPTYITVGTTVPMWALPDPYYHPNYSPNLGNYTLNTAGFTWAWTVPAGLNYTQSLPTNNYITVTGVTIGGPYAISVVETAPAAYGSCAGAPQTLNVNVVDVPSFALTSGADETYNFCAGDPGLPGAINTTISGGWQNYRLAWSLEIATLDAANAKEFYYSDQTGAGKSGLQFYAVNHTTDGVTNPYEAVAASGAHNIMTVPGFPVINNGTRNAVTVYTYQLVSVNDQASRYGNFIALNGVSTAANASSFTYYASPAAADNVVVTVYPTPVTGPIYHISNAWSN
jgi:hypothetical protein